MPGTTHRTKFKLQGTCWESRNKVPLLDMARFDRYPERDIVALCKPVKPMYIVAEIEGVECKIILDSGSSVSLISNTIFRTVKDIIPSPAEQLLLTAPGNKMQSLGEADLEITIGKFRSPQKFSITSSLITDCFLGLDFLANHRISHDFANRVASGPTIGRIATLDLLNDS